MRKLLLPLFIFVSFLGNSQNFKYQVLFEGIGDNREFFSNKALPQTILGGRGAFEFGVEIDNHRIRGGLSQLQEFGSDLDFHKPKLTLYYQFNDEQKEFIFGSFPRRGKIDFPLAMLTDTLLYYRPNIEGMFGEVSWEWGKQNGFVDWVSRQTDINRENFMAGFSGEIFYKNVFIQNYLLMFHDAGASIDIMGDHIKDYIGYAFQAGIRTSEDSNFKGYFKAGLLNSSFRERSVTNGFINSSSLFAEAKGRYKNYGIKSVLSSGGSHKFAYGDRFYQVKNYWRTDAIWYFINHEKVKGTFNLSFHLLDWNDLDQQQQLSIVYIFGK
ncbi:MAG: hypothetical protein HN778_04760 [Prolixibacteraceae bacterium]|jgi:hypothetical protein|nr:hypothetical protein [Prolixibacteraceae bacterium]MBT6004820.1 hypothetical protein [Prolixibacteraceae bacterium]MBT6765951.1 hypothetical protein [Prolixibacteraceae bacterium]MBT7000911.1 hypothetical protein [Prolixibacteraceae bacterium]MBT7394127.1 hypothetical protein [Prolixibacteraceae bacterium]